MDPNCNSQGQRKDANHLQNGLTLSLFGLPKEPRGKALLLKRTMYTSKLKTTQTKRNILRYARKMRKVHYNHI